jgi:hypothetical protein
MEVVLFAFIDFEHESGSIAQIEIISFIVTSPDRWEIPAPNAVRHASN